MDLFIPPVGGLRWRAVQKHSGLVFSLLDGVRAVGPRDVNPRASDFEAHRAAGGDTGSTGRAAGLRLRGQFRALVGLARLTRPM